MGCKYSKRNKFNKLECSLIKEENLNKADGEKKLSPLCPFQRYCTKEMIWENTGAISNCERRK